MRSGFVTVVGRPNVGKSTLVNRMVGTRSRSPRRRPNTTRHRVRGRPAPARRPGRLRRHARAPPPADRPGDRLNETADRLR